MTKSEDCLLEKSYLPEIAKGSKHALVAQMETKRLLIVAFCLTVGLLVMADGAAESFAVTFLVGLAMALLGSIFWVNAE